MFRPIRERCPFANMNDPFANILSRSRVGPCSRTGRISANTLNTCMAMDKKKQVGVRMHLYMQTMAEAANSTRDHAPEVLFARTRVKA